MAKQQQALAAAGASEADMAAAAEEKRASFCGHAYLFSIKHKGVGVLVSGNSKYEPRQPRVKYVVPLQHNEDAFRILGITASIFQLYTPFESSEYYGKQAFMRGSGSTPYTFVRYLGAAGMVALAAEKAAACAAARAAAAAAAAAGGSGGGGGGMP